MALARSQVAAGHAAIEAMAREQIEKAYRHIWGQLGQRRKAKVVVVPYEGYVLHPRAMVGRLPIRHWPLRSLARVARCVGWSPCSGTSPPRKNSSA